MLKILKKFFFITVCLIIVSTPLTVSALNLDNYSKTIANQAGFQTSEVENLDYLDTTIGKAVAMIMGFVGIIFLIMIIVAGFQWMTAGGNEDTAKKAKDRLVSATVGLLIVMSAYLITFFVYQTIKSSSDGSPSGSWIDNEGGYDCQYNADCEAPTPYCDWRDVRSFCAECLTDSHCTTNPNGGFCCNYVLENVCSDDVTCAD